MKKKEMAVLAVFYIIVIIFLSFFLFSDQVLNVSDPIVKKLILFAFFAFAIVIFSHYTGSVVKVILIGFPLLFQLNRGIFTIGDYITLPPVFDDFYISIVDVVMLFLFILFFNFSKLQLYFRYKPIKYYNYLIFLGVLSAFWAFDKNSTIAYIPIICMLPISYYVFSRLFDSDEKNIYYLSIGFLASALLSIIFVWPDYFGVKWFAFLMSQSDDTKNQTVIRGGGLVPRSIIGHMLVCLIPFLYNLGIFYFEKYRKLVHLTCFALVLTLVLTLYRTNFAVCCFAIGLIIWFAIREKKFKANIVWLAIAGIVFLAVTTYIIILNGNSLEDALSRDTLQGRVEQYDAGIQNFYYSAGVGIGMNNYLVSPVSREVMGNNAWVFNTGNTIHNDYLRILCEFGVLGLFLFLIFIYQIFKTKAVSENARPFMRGIKISFVCLFILSFLEPPFNSTALLIIIGAFLAMLRYYSKENSNLLVENDNHLTVEMK